MFLFFRILFIFFLTCTSARADGSTTIQELKLPEYYVGHWTAATIRAGDFSYFLGCHGTGEARYNFGKKERRKMRPHMSATILYLLAFIAIGLLWISI